jgi:hypothetical protein
MKERERGGGGVILNNSQLLIGLYNMDVVKIALILRWTACLDSAVTNRG